MPLPPSLVLVGRGVFAIVVGGFGGSVGAGEGSLVGAFVGCLINS